MSFRLVLPLWANTKVASKMEETSSSNAVNWTSAQVWSDKDLYGCCSLKNCNFIYSATYLQCCPGVKLVFLLFCRKNVWYVRQHTLAKDKQLSQMILTHLAAIWCPEPCIIGSIKLNRVNDPPPALTPAFFIPFSTSCSVRSPARPPNKVYSFLPDYWSRTFTSHCHNTQIPPSRFIPPLPYTKP